MHYSLDLSTHNCPEKCSVFYCWAVKHLQRYWPFWLLILIIYRNTNTIYCPLWKECDLLSGVKCLVTKVFNNLPFLKNSFVSGIWLITNRKFAFFCIYYIRLSPANITLIHWIKIDHVLLNDHDWQLQNCPLVYVTQKKAYFVLRYVYYNQRNKNIKGIRNKFTVRCIILY